MPYKLIILTCFCCLHIPANSQIRRHNIMDGGKTFIEIIKIIQLNSKLKKECLTNQVGDICFKNKSSEKIQIFIYKRTDTGYINNPMKMIVVPKSEECLYGLSSGIYKYQIEFYVNAGAAEILKMGELKLKSCEKSIREIDFIENNH